MSNLEWVTPKENCCHAEKLGLRNHAKGEAHGHAKLTGGKVQTIRWLLRFTKLTQKEISKMFRVSYSTILDIKNSRTWKHLQSLKVSSYV